MFESKGPPKAFQYVAYIFHNQNYLTDTETNHIQEIKTMDILFSVSKHKFSLLSCRSETGTHQD